MQQAPANVSGVVLRWCGSYGFIKPYRDPTLPRCQQCIELTKGLTAYGSDQTDPNRLAMRDHENSTVEDDATLRLRRDNLIDCGCATGYYLHVSRGPKEGSLGIYPITPKNLTSSCPRASDHSAWYHNKQLSFYAEQCGLQQIFFYCCHVILHTLHLALQ